MAARHLLLAIFVALLAAIAVRVSIPADSSRSDESAAAPLDDTRPDAAPASSVWLPATAVAADSNSAVPTTVTTTAISTPGTSLPSEELVDLLDAARPPLIAVEVADDGEHAAHNEPESSVGGTAASVVVSAWTWRFDDSAGRVRTQLNSSASEAVIAKLAPTPEQETERASAGEVSWVIVREIAIDGSVATVMFDQHLVTSTDAETITARSAVITVVDGRAIEVNE